MTARCTVVYHGRPEDAQGDSLIMFAVKAITKTDNAYSCQWVESCLNGTMGTRPTHSHQPGMPLGDTPVQVPGHFAAELGRGVALGLQALEPLKPLTGHQGGANKTNSKLLYGEEDIPALMGVSCVKRGRAYRIFGHISRHQKGKTWMCAADISWHA
jgi:hypothetical protein